MALVASDLQIMPDLVAKYSGNSVKILLNTIRCIRCLFAKQDYVETICSRSKAQSRILINLPNELLNSIRFINNPFI